jgi:hypothetical protein
MSEREFELYLSLLSRFLRLNPNQRKEIADELRDHLAERLEELTAEGLSRVDVIHRALSEFGDAADLAAHFTHIANRRKRRFIMRCTVGTVVTTAAVILIATAFWPQNPAVNLPPQLVAQNQADTGNNKKLPAKPRPATKSESSSEQRIRAALDGPTELDLVDMPLNDVIAIIRKLHGINIVLDQRILVEASVDTNQIVNYQLSGIKLRSALKIILEQLDEPLTYIIEDEIMKITTVQEANARLSIRVYPIRDLVITPAALQKSGVSLVTVITSTVQPKSWARKTVFRVRGVPSASGPGVLVAVQGLV